MFWSVSVSAMIVSGRGRVEDDVVVVIALLFWEEEEVRPMIPHCSRSCRVPIEGFVNRTCISLSGVCTC